MDIRARWALQAGSVVWMLGVVVVQFTAAAPFLQVILGFPETLWKVLLVIVVLALAWTTRFLRAPTGERPVGVLYVATMLFLIHYGTGFLLGTAEEVDLYEKGHQGGAGGALYAVSCAVGLLALAAVAKLYFPGKYIWDVLGGVDATIAAPVAQREQTASTRYWAWLGYLRHPWTGRLLIAASSASLFLVVYQVSRGLDPAISLYLSAIGHFARDLPGILAAHDSLPGDRVISVLGTGVSLRVWGIILPTVLVTVLGADFQSCIQNVGSPAVTVKACLLASVGLFFAAFLPASAIIAGWEAARIDTATSPGRALPVLMNGLGGLGKALGLIIVITAMGSAAGVSMAMVKAFPWRTLVCKVETIEGDFWHVPVRKVQTMDDDSWHDLVLIVYVVMAAGISIAFGKGIVPIVVSFYVIFVAGALVPTIAYGLSLAPRSGDRRQPPRGTFAAIVAGSTVAGMTFLVWPWVTHDAPEQIALPALAFGALASTMVLVGARIHARTRSQHELVK